MQGMRGFGFDDINSNVQLGSYITEKEIIKVKEKLRMLTVRLFNIHDIEEETSINNEIKNETEFLSSLLTIKTNDLNQNKHMNNIELRQMQEEIIQEEMKRQQMIQKQNIQVQQEEEMPNILNENIITEFTVVFRTSGPDGKAFVPIQVKFKPDDKVSKIIEKYRIKSGDQDPNKKFIFNAKNLKPNLSADEVGLCNNSNIFVVATKCKKEG